MTIENLEIKQSIDEIKTEIQNIWDKMYPIGSIYISVNDDFDPNGIFPGTWEKFGVNEELGIGYFLKAPDVPNAKGQLELVGGTQFHNHNYSVSYDTTKWILTAARATKGNSNIDADDSITTTGQHYNTNSVLGNGNVWDYGDGDRHVSTGVTEDTEAIPPYITVQPWKRIS